MSPRLQPLRHVAERLSGLINDQPEPEEVVPVVGTLPPVPPRPIQRLKVMTWNVQFCAGRHHFFYDGGPTVSVSAEQVRATAAGIAAVLREEQADLVLLQEVDRGARRTAFLDELGLILDQAPYPVWLSSRYHRSRYVPHPSGEPMGQVEMHLVTLSRLPLVHGRRLALPGLRESWLRRQFNLRRCVLTAEVPDLGLSVANTHLSAFANGDGTVPRQMEILDAWMQDKPRFILGGDLNALPPGDDAARLAPHALEYADPTPPLSRLLPHRRSVIPPDALLQPEHRTFLPAGRDKPDRVLDYVFVGPTVHVRRAWVRDDVPELSDHLPLIAELEIAG